MNVVKMNLADLRRPKRNIRMHTEAQLKEFERSVSMFGQIRPIVVDENNEILAGNGLYETLLRMGYTEADVLKMEGLTDNQKKKLMIADNRIFNLGVDDLNTLEIFLVDLKDDLDIPGFDEEILQTMVAQAEEVSDKISQYGVLDEDEIEDIQQAHERKLQNIAAAQQSADSSADEEPYKKLIICPNCGEKIWL